MCWAKAMLSDVGFVNHSMRQDSKDVFVLGSVEDITVALEDSLVTISTIEACQQASDWCYRAGSGSQKDVIAA